MKEEHEITLEEYTAFQKRYREQAERKAEALVRELEALGYKVVRKRILEFSTITFQFEVQI